jgi:hypothetical protein
MLTFEVNLMSEGRVIQKSDVGWGRAAFLMWSKATSVERCGAARVWEPPSSQTEKAQGPRRKVGSAFLKWVNQK